MMRKFVFLFLILFFSTYGEHAYCEDLPPLPKGPLLLTSTTWDQLNANYWIERLPDPDKVIMSPTEIARFNNRIREIDKDSVDIFKMDPSMPGVTLSKLLESEFNTLRGRKLFGIDDQYIKKTFFDTSVKPIVSWESVPKTVKLKWGAAIQNASVRAIPTDVSMLEEKGDIEFDQLQFTKIKLWTPVAIYHKSSDGKWFYIAAPYARGWVKAKDIAVFANREELRKYVKSEKFLMVTGESIRIFNDPQFQKQRIRVSMGTRLPLMDVSESSFSVTMPERKLDGSVVVSKGYISRKSDVTRGLLPYTQRNILKQAFKLLGARYGWGGLYDGRDCSGFTHDVFLSLGIDMPRNSKPQGFIGTQLDHFTPFQNEIEKMNALRQATPGITLLRMPMHMMLYLGEVDGQFYVIHSTWAERISMTSDEKNRINQVVVSDLSLNGSSRIGSLFDRIISINELQ